MKPSIRILTPVVGVTAVAVLAIGWLALPSFWSSSDQDWQPLPRTVLLSLAVVLTAGCIGVLLAIRVLGQLMRQAHRLADDVEAAIEGPGHTPPAAHTPSDIFDGPRARLYRLGARTRVALEQRERVEREARTDALTDLPNRRGLTEFMETALAEARAAPGPDSDIAVLHVDLDHFKSVNDRLGHEAGDFVLKEATRRMQAVLRESDMLARLGGDEFIVVAPGITGADVIERMAGRLVARFAEPIQYRQHACLIGASVGAVVARPADADLDPRALLNQADIALCHAKATGRNRAAVFSDEMATQLSQTEKQAREIRQAVIDDCFQPWFQPMIDTETGAVTGLELLSRWHHPERGVIPPDDFLMAAENHGMLEEIGLQVLSKACMAIRDWRADGLDVPRLYVNMTRSQLLAPAAVDKITWILDDNNLPPERVSLEISERDLGERAADLLYANLRRLAALGVEKVLDDFGAADGAIRNAVAMGAGKLKCARLLIRGLHEPETAEEARATLIGAVGLARALDAKPLAKGVEDQAWVETLSALGLKEMQGDALAPAMPVDSLPEWLGDRPAATRIA